MGVKGRVVAAFRRQWAAVGEKGADGAAWRVSCGTWRVSAAMYIECQSVSAARWTGAVGGWMRPTLSPTWGDAYERERNARQAQGISNRAGA
jgi:hypothetical protein